jgi:hypothetical protein
MLRVTEYDSDNIYTMPGVRQWRRYAPPCPPLPESEAAMIAIKRTNNDHDADQEKKVTP